MGILQRTSIANTGTNLTSKRPDCNITGNSIEAISPSAKSGIRAGRLDLFLVVDIGVLPDVWAREVKASIHLGLRGVVIATRE